MKNMQRGTTVLLFLLAVSFSPLFAQTPYAVFFAPKEQTATRLAQPLEFLSPRALERRSRQHIALTPQDLPVFPERISGVRSIASKTGRASKWLNAVYVEATPEELLALLDLPFVERVQPLAGLGTTIHTDPVLTDYGASEGQLSQINLDGGPHQSAYFGQGMLIAVLDAGFVGAADHWPAENSGRQRAGCDPCCGASRVDSGARGGWDRDL